MRRPGIFTVLALATIGCSRPLEKASLSRPSPAGYAGPRACDGCHADIAASYRSVAMAQSFGRPEAGNRIEEFERANRYTHAPSGFTYEMFVRDGRIIQRRFLLDRSGRPRRLFEREATFFIGSGRHARSYLHLNPAGELTELPITWYSQERAWGMSPGYDRADHPDFFRPVTYRCMFCHNAYPALPAGSDSAIGPQIFPADLPSGIDCERCHGPGVLHVRLAGSKASSFEEVRASIVNPARLPPARQLDVCMQCHLETTSSGNWSGVVTFGRGVFSFRPGQDLASYVTHFDHPPGRGHDDKFEIAHQAYRLRQSACFKESGGRMTCMTCHDPHRRPEEPGSYFSAKCRTCHDVQECGPASRASADAGLPVNCIPCHMTSRRCEDVVHVTMTDHLIRRALRTGDMPLAPRRERPKPYRGPIAFYAPDEIPEGPERDLLLGVASVLDGVDRDRGLALLERGTAARASKTAEVPFQLGLTLQSVGRQRDALAALEQAVSLEPRNARILLALGNGLVAAGRHEEALMRFQQAMAVWPNCSEALTNAGNVLALMGRLEAALVGYERALSARPDNAQALASRGAVLSRFNRFQEAESALNEALRIFPGQADATLTLVPILLSRGDVAEALIDLEDAARRNPSDPAILTRLAWVQATTARADLRDGRRAFVQATRAVELTHRQDPRALDALAAALAERGRPAEAARVAAEALSVARAGGQEALMAAIEARHSQYRKGLPYRERTPDSAKAAED